MTQEAGAPRAREIRGVAEWEFLRAVARRTGELHLPAFAAGLAYGAVFALLPMLALLVFLLGIFQATDLVAQSIDQLDGVLPADALALIDEQLTSVATTSDQGSFGLAALLSVLVALWGASGAMRRVMEALTVVHRADETRGFARKLLVSLALALGAIVVIIVTLLVTVVGGDVASRVFELVGLGETAESAWAYLRWPLLLVLVWFGIAAAYRFAPSTRQVGGLLTPGTLFATIGWVIFSLGFSWYVGGIGDMRASWGAVAGVIVLLLYLQYAGLIVLLGALIDVELFDRGRPVSRTRRALHMPPTKR